YCKMNLGVLFVYFIGEIFFKSPCFGLFKFYPIPVHIYPCHIVPPMSFFPSIGIEHGNDYYFVFFSELLGLFGRRQQYLHKMPQGQVTGTFWWMLASDDHNHFLSITSFCIDRKDRSVEQAISHEILLCISRFRQMVKPAVGFGDGHYFLPCNCKRIRRYTHLISSVLLLLVQCHATDRIRLLTVMAQLRHIPVPCRGVKELYIDVTYFLGPNFKRIPGTSIDRRVFGFDGDDKGT